MKGVSLGALRSPEFRPVTLTTDFTGGISQLLPAVQVPAVQGPPSLQGFVVAQDGTGDFAGAPGTGRVSIQWGHDLNGGFNAQLGLKPFAHPGGAN